jgi:hypothetical protein
MARGPRAAHITATRRAFARAGPWPMTLRALSALLCALALTGCVGATPYGPAEGPGDYGYGETRLADGSWRVEVSANTSTGRETVERHLMRRAAELTLESGAEAFVMTSRELTPVTFYAPVIAARPRPSFLFESRRSHDRRRRDPHDPFGWRREERLARMGVGVGPGRDPFAYPLERPVTRWRGSAEIRMATPADSDARDARAVLATMNAR